MARIVDEILNYKSKDEDDGVLRNKLGIKDQESLSKAERMITSYKLAKLYLDPGEQTFDVKHYLSIHKFLFEDIYYFAGEIRTENIAKRIPFCVPDFIFSELTRVLKNARDNIYKIDSRDKLLRFIVELYAEIDIIHPFREGNGRVEREFIRQLMEYICKVNYLENYYLDYTLITDRNAYIDAVVKADALLDYKDLLLLFDSIMIVREKTVDYSAKKR